jgi:S-adenosylmethionine decarboxylase
MSAGRHLLVDFFGVAPGRLRDRRGLMATLGAALKKSGFTIVRRRSGFHKFPSGGKGVTGFFLLAQSHAAFHSYPENGYLALDVYTCGEADPRRIADALKRFLKPRSAKTALRRRGA